MSSTYLMRYEITNVLKIFKKPDNARLNIVKHNFTYFLLTFSHSHAFYVLVLKKSNFFITY
jgi:hypothetical protein